mmetsp:Transcript_2186/g.8302  ORF Transcript_2186/g.8302 Transcript_2186/m.8302 type:complete len:265 (+) Transcript_2186:95-889(+)
MHLHQYDLAKMQTSLAGAPLTMHLCGPAGCSKGKHRIVAPVSSLTRFSSSSLPSHPPRAHLPASIAATSSSYEFTSTMLASLNARACARYAPCTSARVPSILATRALGSTATSNSFPSFPGRSRLATTHAFLATSLGPTSTRTGTPFISHCANFHPGELRSSSSTLTLIPAFVRVVAMAFAASATAALSLFFCAMGTTTTCIGASAGGSRSPASSPCVMMTPPMRRVETPQEDWYTCLVSPFSSRKVVSNALEKFWPRLCDVPA